MPEDVENLAEGQEIDNGHEEEDYSLDFGTDDGGDQSGQNLTQLEEQKEGENGEPASAPESMSKEAEQKPELSDTEALQHQLNEALGRIAAYEAEKLAVPPKGTEPKEQPKPDAQQPQTQVQPQEQPELDFLQGRDHIEILQDPVKFNALLQQVAMTAFTAAVNASQEEVFKKIPRIIQESAEQHSHVQSVTQEFYKQNPDLVNFRQAVSMAAMQLYNENPSLDLPQLLAGAANRTREMLRLSKTGTRPARKPAQPAGGSLRSAGGDRAQSGKADGLTDEQRQIMELLDL